MSGATKTDLDGEEQMQRILKMDLEMDQIRQTMRYATIQIYLNTIGIAVTLAGGVITAVRLLLSHG